MFRKRSYVENKRFPEKSSFSQRRELLERLGSAIFVPFLRCFGSLCGSKIRDVAYQPGRGASPSWLHESTVAQGCQGRRRRGEAGALTAL